MQSYNDTSTFDAQFGEVELALSGIDRTLDRAVSAYQSDPSYDNYKRVLVARDAMLIEVRVLEKLLSCIGQGYAGYETVKAELKSTTE
jgi:hypothetical protein